MATASPTTPDFSKLERKTFRFDWVTSLIMSTVVLSGAIVLWLSAVWVTNQVWEVHPPAAPIDIIEIAIDEGSTEVRIGTAIFGGRTYGDDYYWPEGSRPASVA